MLFNSYAFAIFLPIVFILYWSLPHRFRWILLFAASYYFYMCWDVRYVALVLFSTLYSYIAALCIENERKKKAGNPKLPLIGTTLLCLGVLFVFKYYTFVTDTITDILRSFSIQIEPLTMALLLPVGISFYTFQTLSYVIDVYRGEVPAERHFGYYATFISFFPQLVAGPIERTTNLLPQIKAEHKFDYQQATYGLKLMAWGFFKKIVIADTLSKYVSAVYNTPQNYSGFALVIATILFAFQIYCDFSGYSDIAIGTAGLFGVKLTNNFKCPYLSQSIKEFWSRWHITLSTWFRDYIYIPMGGNRVGKLRYVFNLMVTFLISGLWHGASWTFVLWGGIHGVLQAVETFLIPKNRQKSKGILRWVRTAAVFLIVCFAWIFFVSDSISDACYVVTHLFTGISDPILYLTYGFAGAGINVEAFITICVLLLILAAYDGFSLKYDVIQVISKQKKAVRWTIYAVFVLLIIFLCQKGVAAEFVYFQF